MTMTSELEVLDSQPRKRVTILDLCPMWLKQIAKGPGAKLERPLGADFNGCMVGEAHGFPFLLSIPAYNCRTCTRIATRLVNTGPIRNEEDRIGVIVSDKYVHSINYRLLNKGIKALEKHWNKCHVHVDATTKNMRK